MDHLAVMKPSWKLVSKILSGEKTIESRWYKNKSAPWNKIKSGDTIYFKEGKFVSTKASVEKILQFSGFGESKIREIYKDYAKAIGIEDHQIENSILNKKGKKYCILTFLKNARRIEPFRINKTGYGIGCAWICVGNIEKIKLNF